MNEFDKELGTDNAAPAKTEPDLGDEILRYMQNQATPRPVHPSQIARHLAGKDEKEWRLLMKPLRREVVALAQKGIVEVIRKGKVVNPLDFKGVYQIRLIEKH